MINKNLISVVTIVFNDLNQIEKTIQSILNQSYKKIEFIIIDGGSIDGTKEIIIIDSTDLVNMESDECKFEPIPLSEDILINCGFDKSGYKQLSNRLKLEWSFGKEFWIDREGETLFTFENIESLHQLQNIYFALTGKELIINL
jgi:glycosyltransferase involved in cell wall biosynthesis